MYSIRIARGFPCRVMVMALLSVGLARCETVPPEPSVVPPSAGEPASPVTGPSVFIPIPEDNIHTPPPDTGDKAVIPPPPVETEQPAVIPPPPVAERASVKPPEAQGKGKKAPPKVSKKKGKKAPPPAHH
jgi:hypothetical protein